MRHRPEPLSFEDIGRAARALARLPDTDANTAGNALAALAWTSVNFLVAIEADGSGPFPLSMSTEGLIGLCAEGVNLHARPRAAKTWRALSFVAAALAHEGDDPSQGATHFHHGSAAPDWALSKDATLWIGRWAFYGGVNPTQLPPRTG
jgi:hypothetical protein